MKYDYVKNIDSISKGSRYILKHAFGKKLSDAGIRELSAFYETRPSVAYEENAFFVSTMNCYYGQNDVPKMPFADAIALYYIRSTESRRATITRLIDANYSNSNLFFKKLTSAIRCMQDNGIYIDGNDMLRELNWWNENRRGRKTKIAKKICAMEDRC